MYVLSLDGMGGDTLRHLAGPAHAGLVTCPSSPSAWRPAPPALTWTWVLRPAQRPPAPSPATSKSAACRECHSQITWICGYRQPDSRAQSEIRIGGFSRPVEASSFGNTDQMFASTALPFGQMAPARSRIFQHVTGHHVLGRSASAR